MTVFKSAGGKVEVFPNRLEYKLGPRKEMILFRNITKIVTKSLIAGVEVHTNDGKKKMIPCKLKHKDELANLILSSL